MFRGAAGGRSRYGRAGPACARALAMDGRGETSAVAPLRNARLATLRGVGMLVAACATLPCADVHAQLASPSYTDPLSAKLQTSPRNPPLFQKLDREGLAHWLRRQRLRHLRPAPGRRDSIQPTTERPEPKLKSRLQPMRRRSRPGRPRWPQDRLTTNQLK